MRRPQFTIGMLIRATLFAAVAVAGLNIPIEMEESNHSDHGLRLNRRSFKSLRELERIRARELTKQFLRGSNDIIRRSST